jgi:hypothetical protein
MIGVIYAPKSQETVPQPSTNEVEDTTSNTRTPSTPGGERKMNVVRGGQSMFVKKEMQRPASQQVGWGTWVWNNVVGEKTETSNTAGTNVGVVVGGGQSNVVVRALKGLSETVFGF